VNFGSAYSFQPIASDPDGNALTFSIANKPVWATFSTSTGLLTGTPTLAQAGTTSSIVISVSDGALSASLAAFNLTVVGDVAAPTASVSPAAGSYANSVTVTLSASDTTDPAPKIYYTTNGSTPTTSSAQYSAPLVLTSSATVKFLARDASGNQSAVQSAAYSITQPPVIGSGLSFVAADTALPGVTRVDGGPVTSNLDAATGKPMIDVEYSFRVVYQDTSGAGASNGVYLVLNGYAFPMTKGSGSLATGINYTYTTWLGPASAWTFHYEVLDGSGNILFRLPQSGELAGPQIRVLNGGKLLGVAKNLNTASVTPSQAFGAAQAFEWVNGKFGRGRYREVSLIENGKGYYVKDSTLKTLPALNELTEQTASSYSIPLTRGWNLVSNPYGGNVKLSDVQVRQGSKQPVSWLQATSNKWLTNAIYYFRGSDWDSSNSFESAGGYPDAKIAPWIGYWVYLSASDGPYTLILPKPQK
jgi:hypothetical protein